MINNSVAVQRTRNKDAALNFYWQRSKLGNNSFIEDPEAKPLSHWLWPLDGFCKNGILYEFVNEIKKTTSADPAFGFEAVQQLIMRVDNPGDAPDKWHIKLTPVAAPGLQSGSAVVTDANFLYVFCSYLPARTKLNQHPQIIIRVPLEKINQIGADSADTGNHKAVDLYALSEMWGFPISKDKAQRVANSSTDGAWIKSSNASPKIVFEDGAPEFSVTRVKGIDGYFAVYFPAGFGNQIMIRHSLRPEGPWSKPECIYKCPIDTQRFFVYSAKNHPELCSREGELCITYCENIKSNDLPAARPEDYYFPHAINVLIKTRISPAIK